MARGTKWWAVAVALALVVTACSDDNDSDAQGGSTTTSGGGGGSSEGVDRASARVGGGSVAVGRQAEPGETIFADELTSDDNNWGEADNSRVSLEFGPDGYAVTLKAGADVPLTLWPDAQTEDLADNRVAVQATVAAGAAAGVACRIAGTGNVEAYALTVSADGQYAIDRVDGGDVTSLAEGQGDAVEGNAVEVAGTCVDGEDGVELALSVDGTEVLTATDADEGLAAGQSGLFLRRAGGGDVDSEASAVFSQFEIQSASGDGPGPGEGVIFEDDFSDAASGWFVADGGTWSSKYVDGTLVLETTDAGGVENPAPVSAADFSEHIAVEVKIDPSEITALAGIEFGTDNSNFYLFEIDGADGSVWGTKIVNGFDFDDAPDDVFNDGVIIQALAGGEPAVLRIEVAPNEDGSAVITFLVDGEEVMSYEDAEPIPVSYAALEIWTLTSTPAGSTITGVFDDFVLTNLG
jgi:hypothetical protein